MGVIALNSVYLDPKMASVFYCIGVSIYSTALVLAPSLFVDNKFCKDTKFRSGVLYAVAGWFGSAMGIGMAQDLHIVPITFIIISGVFLIVLNTPVLSSIKKISVISSLLLFFSPHASAEDINSLINKGREVYISEGCINCHSQFVRPIGKDVEMWGPYVDYEKILKGVPPLIGNRRQGPDLLNVGNRRSREWLELHLKKPRDFLPWSRMPSYEYLFKDERGNALVDYLVSLGSDTIPQRLSYIRSWTINKYEILETEKTTRNLYLSHCANCHGANGDGNGVLASTLNNKPRKLNSAEFAYVNFNSWDAVDNLAKIIKFGIPGTNMAGHEYFSDSEILSLLEFIKKLSQGGSK
jgi:cytochrome c oxidase cbb3-type subunit 2